MNENLNLVEILKDCPMGTKLYSLIWGECKLYSINYNGESYPIKLKLYNESFADITKDGRHNIRYNGECTLFPSKEVRTWDNFHPKKQKFDPKTLQPFDKILVRYGKGKWICGIFSHLSDYVHMVECVGGNYSCCVPYNDDTKHLVGTLDEAPEFYRYWED